jgi:hypothetical protein
MEPGFQLVFNLVFACACAAIAKSKGRSAVGWFFAGLVITCIGLIIILCLSDEKAAARQREKAGGERRRLREQLRQERMKTEAYRRHTAARLDAHDDSLGVDTRSLGGLPEGHGQQGGNVLPEGSPAADFVHDQGSQPSVIPTAGSAAPGSRVKEWFYELGGESRGPVSEAAVRMGLGNGKLEATTLIWREGMPNWQAISEVPLFSSTFRG